MHAAHLRALPALLAGVVLASCDPGAQGATQVKMHDNAFNAPVVRIPAGAGVAWMNAGRNPHNIVPVDPSLWPASFDTAAVSAGKVEEVVLTKPGVYAYYCAYHGTKDGQGMAGTIVVGDVPFTSAAKGRIAAVAEPSGVTREVPKRYPTIQAAVDAATPGDLILIDSGTYKEEVTVTTPSLTIRGVDRNAVVVDGEFIRPNGINVLADAVAVENLTARNHTFNGVFWNGVTGFRGRYLTAINNGDYGIYTFDSRDGLIEDSYGSGSPDAGFYIGQCDPCNAVIRRVISEHNTLGYSGTNSSGNLYLLSSTWRYNRGGIVPNSLDTELHPPQHSTVIRGNLIHDNNSQTAPGNGLGPLAQGMGVVIGGGHDNIIEGNVIADHTVVGVMIAPLIDKNWWPATGNYVSNNLILNSGRADISIGGPTSAKNCVVLQQNEVTLAPRVLACHRPPIGPDATSHGGFPFPYGIQNDMMIAMTLGMRMWRLDGSSFPDWRTQPEPPAQPSMPDARTAPARPAYEVFASIPKAELEQAPLPPQADSVARAASARNAPPAGTPRVGRVLSKVQSWVPLTPLALLAWVVVLLFARLRIWSARRAGAQAVELRRAARVFATLGVMWVMLSVVTAWAFSGM